MESVSRTVTKTRLEDYLTTIYRLEEALGKAKTTDISRELGVSPASVSKVLQRLEKKNLVKRSRYRYIELTDEGRKIAEQIIRKHRIAEVFLASVLGFNDVDSHRYAHYLEHLPDDVIERIYNLVGKPTRCPHGNIIPGVIESPEADMSTGLSNANRNDICVIKRMAGEFLNVIEYLYKLGIKVGILLRIVEVSHNGVVVELTNGNHVEIPMYMARYIFVQCR